MCCFFHHKPKLFGLLLHKTDETTAQSWGSDIGDFFILFIITRQKWSKYFIYIDDYWRNIAGNGRAACAGTEASVIKKTM